MSQNLMPAQQFMKQYNLTELELQFIKKKNMRAVLMFEGQYFVNMQEVEAKCKCEEIFLSSIE